MSISAGRLYSSKGRLVFVGCTIHECPRINLLIDGVKVKFMDDFSRKRRAVRTVKPLAMAIFR